MVVVGAMYDKVMFLPPGTPDSIVRMYLDATSQMVKDTDRWNSGDMTRIRCLIRDRVPEAEFQSGWGHNLNLPFN